MSNKIEFDFSSKTNPKNKLTWNLITTIVLLLFFLFSYNFFDWKIYIYVLVIPFTLAVNVIEYVRFTKFKNKKALIITSENIMFQEQNIQESWDNVNGLGYRIKMVSSYLLFDVKNKKMFISNQKWHKRIGLHINKLRFNTPFVVNLEQIKGETDVNYKKIESFVKEYKLLVLE